MATPRAYRTRDSIDTSAGSVKVAAVVGAGVGYRNPQGGSQGTGGPRTPGRLFDLESVSTWRIIIAGLAVLYIAGFHIGVPGVGRVQVGR